MNLQTQIAKAQHFRKRHDRSAILLLPNAWDAGSAKLFSQRGFAAVATTSGGLAWSLGYADGERAPLVEVLAAIARITRVVELPVTVDMETGYGDSLTDLTAAIQAVIAAGAVGINIEDGLPGHGPLRSCEAAAARIQAARAAASAAGMPLVINARVDTYLQGKVVDEAERFADTVRRARAYLAAGADCVYPLGLSDAATLATLVKTIEAPVNVAAAPNALSLAELFQLGVARVSTATRFATLALAAVDHAAGDLLESGRFAGLASSFTYSDAQRLFE